MNVRMVFWALLAAGPVLATGTVNAAEPAATGTAVYQRWCVACHGAGPDKPGTGALQEKYHGTLPAMLEKRTDLSAAFVRQTVRHGVSVMPPFRKTEISDAELSALAAYLSRQTPAGSR